MKNGEIKAILFVGNALYEGAIDTQVLLTYGAEDERYAGAVILDFWLCAEGRPHLSSRHKSWVLDDDIQ